MDDELRRFRRLVDVATVATFVLILVGGVVRVSDSGLGCGAAGSGTHGWPLCGGRLVPFIRTNMIIEYTHRLVAAVVVGLLVVLAWRTLRRLRAQRWLRRGALGALALVVVQAALGGLTVEHDLHTALVAAHLGTAMLLLGTLIVLSWAARAELSGRRVVEGAVEGERSLRAIAVGAPALVMATIVSGGVIAGTERHGTTQVGLVEGAHLACGKQFPTCNGALLPFGSNGMVDIQLVHRTLMLATLLAIAAFVFLARRRRAASRMPLLVGGLAAAQALLGALNVWLGEHGGLVVAHLTLGTLLWAATLAASLQLLRARAPQPASATRGRDGSYGQLGSAAR